MTNAAIQQLQDQVQLHNKNVQGLAQQLSTVVIGQQQVVNDVLIALLCNGHVLIEGIPGLGKTLLVKALAQSMQGEYHRVQFTPDLLPADITGTLVYNQKSGDFTVRKGPVFTNILLADEINRSPAKVQSALLEAMQERQVTIGDHTYNLPQPFIVLATQNPLDQQGTYQLPEAQLDRFFLKTLIAYPSLADEQAIMEKFSSNNGSETLRLQPAISDLQLQQCQQLVKSIYMEPNVAQYIMQIVAQSRQMNDQSLAHGISTRGSINIAMAAKANAFINGKAYVSPDDVQTVLIPVCRHRVTISYDAQADGVTSDQVLQKLLRTVKVP
jgi:MoxR-like ATPase